MNLKKQPELRDKIVAGLEIAYERRLEFKRQKNSKVMVMRDRKIVRIKPNHIFCLINGHDRVITAHNS